MQETSLNQISDLLRSPQIDFNQKREKKIGSKIENFADQNDENLADFGGLEGLTKTVTVGIPTIFTDGPENIRLNPTGDNIDVVEGKCQNVNCLADCKPDCNITWSKDSSTTILNNPLSLSTNQTDSFNCTVRHTVLNKQLTKQLNVQIYYQPDKTSITTDAVNNTADEGSDVIFNCNVDSKPVSTITWSSSTSTDTYTGQHLTLNQAKCQDTGI
ncbi:hypothetical protein LOTGIDRAFT_175673 [Lottia gigantea]|uniref:Ig-like domain-containing protein n=1 Tax=Lottia gigantea TaxID=225164 RepID=V4A7G5_LOTGI|nr:hypothetical protein LOTGIDRAFT_175673 [Lottia gigantea]ESO92692.1 hypothetical protein LOTGIDRAFT_175673 [Lottia gigantea]